MSKKLVATYNAFRDIDKVAEIQNQALHEVMRHLRQGYKGCGRGTKGQTSVKGDEELDFRRFLPSCFPDSLVKSGHTDAILTNIRILETYYIKFIATIELA